MKKLTFNYKCGMYVNLCVPYLSRENHPFTLSSAPEQDYFSVHVQVLYTTISRFADLMQL